MDQGSSQPLTHGLVPRPGAKAGCLLRSFDITQTP